MIPKLIHQTAPTNRLTWEEERLARRLRRMLPDWTYRLWSNADQERLFGERFPQHLDRFRRIRFGMARADLARYAILCSHGGFYVDTDYKLLKRLDDWLDHDAILPVEYVRADGGLDLGSSILASAKGYPFWRDLIEHIFEHNAPELLEDSAAIPEITGPVVMTKFYDDNAERYPGIFVPRKNLFQPDISYFGTRSSADKDTVGVHLTFGMWRQRSPLVAAKTLIRRKLNGLLS